MNGTLDNVVGLRLCKFDINNDLRVSEDVMFEDNSMLFTVLFQAATCGSIGPFGAAGTFYADLIDNNHELVETILLDEKSWTSLKNKWAKCHMLRK